MIPRRLVPVVVFGLGLVPGAAQACMVCGEATEETQAALLTSTIVLSLLPLAMIFGGLYALWHAAGKPSFEERHAGEAP